MVPSSYMARKPSQSYQSRKVVRSALAAARAVSIVSSIHADMRGSLHSMPIHAEAGQ